MTSNSLLRLFVAAYLSFLAVAYVVPFLPRSTRTSRGLKPVVFGNVFGAPTRSTSVWATADEATETKAEDDVAEAEAEAVTEEAAPEAAAEETSEAAEEAPKPKISITRERHTIFVGNLPFDTKDTELKEVFAEHGKVELVSVPKNRDDGRSRGFAFVDMGTPEEVEIAVSALDGTQFGGRTLRVNKSLPKEEAKKQPKKVDEGLKKIYIGNIAFEAEKQDLIEFFSEYGEVSDVYIPVDPNTGNARGFAFLSMAEAAADAAIEATNGVPFMGRRIAVSVPLPPGQKSQRERSPRTKLYVGNLSFYTTADTLRALFEEFGTVFDCYLPEDADTGGSRGFGFITMDVDAAQGAIDEADGCELDGRIIRVNEAQPKFAKREQEEEAEFDEGFDEE